MFKQEAKCACAMRDSIHILKISKVMERDHTWAPQVGSCGHFLDIINGLCRT